jgi:hypothetical protein
VQLQIAHLVYLLYAGFAGSSHTLRSWDLLCNWLDVSGMCLGPATAIAAAAAAASVAIYVRTIMRVLP